MYIKNYLLFILMAFLILSSVKSQSMEPEEKGINLFPSSNLTQDVQKYIFESIVMDICYEIGHAGSLVLVCIKWYKFINESWYISPLYKGIKVNLPDKCLHEIFYGGELLYYPKTSSTGGIIHLKISDLLNPQEGIFYLPEGARDFLSVSTGYRKEMVLENENKIEIWITTREYIKRELKEGRAKQFQGILQEWKLSAPIGIFWTLGSWHTNYLNWYDHLIDQSISSLNSSDLYDHCSKTPIRSIWYRVFYMVQEGGGYDSYAKGFYIRFNRVPSMFWC